MSSAAGGAFSDAYGRRTALLLADLLFATGCILLAAAHDVSTLIAGESTALGDALQMPALLRYEVANNCGACCSESAVFGAPLSGQSCMEETLRSSAVRLGAPTPPSGRPAAHALVHAHSGVHRQSTGGPGGGLGSSGSTSLPSRVCSKLHQSHAGDGQRVHDHLRAVRSLLPGLPVHLCPRHLEVGPAPVLSLYVQQDALILLCIQVLSAALRPSALCKKLVVASCRCGHHADQWVCQHCCCNSADADIV